MSTVPETLNGHDVVNTRQHANCFTVMVERGADLPFVVATWWPALGSQWMWGHYCHDRDEADAAFVDVAARNRSR